ncbi:MAG: hypothetical protein PVG91_07580 [Gammaproteobacteria bacterium]|jgi:hypothetical protein
MSIKPGIGLLIALALAAPSAWGWGSCKYTADRQGEIATDGATTVEIFALAGELRVTGRKDATSVTAAGEACVSREDMLPAIDITVRRDGDRIQVLAEMPDTSGETERRWRDEYATLDLEIELPDDVAVILHDSSGDLLLRGVASAEVSDSSGDMELKDIGGPVLIPRDSSGDIFMSRVGAVVIQVDSSGEIRIEEAASVTIANDTSGDITLEEIDGDVLIANDSSGRIAVRDVRGSFLVENDTSGGIRYSNVAGAVSLPEDRHDAN